MHIRESATGGVGGVPTPCARVEHSTCGGPRPVPRPAFRDGDRGSDLHLLPDLVTGRHPVPAGASVSVRARDAVADRLGTNSGCHRDRARLLGEHGSRGRPSLGALPPSTEKPPGHSARCFKDSPKGTIVSVWVFGRAVGFEKTVKDAEQNAITRIQDPMAWDPGDAGQLKRMMDKVDYPRG